MLCEGPTFELPGEAAAGVSPPQGPPASRPVGGLSTLRSFVETSVPVRAALHPLSDKPPATSALMLVSEVRWCSRAQSAGTHSVSAVLG